MGRSKGGERTLNPADQFRTSRPLRAAALRPGARLPISPHLLLADEDGDDNEEVMVLLPLVAICSRTPLEDSPLRDDSSVPAALLARCAARADQPTWP